MSEIYRQLTKNRMYANFFLLTSIFVSVCSLDIYTSTAQVKQSFQVINALRTTTNIETFLDTKEKQLDQIEKIVESLKELSAESTDPHFDLEHPLNVYRFIRNHSIVYNRTVEQLFKAIDDFEKGKLNASKLQSVMKKLPTQRDLEGITEGIFRLQEVYDLPADDLISGKSTFGHQETLTAKQCQYVARRALALEKYFYARDWIHLAYFMVKIKGDTTVPMEEVLVDASEIALSAGNVKEALKMAEHLVNKKPSDRKFYMLYKKCKSKYESMTVEQQTLSEQYGKEPPSPSEKEENFNTLCRGKGDILKQKSGSQKKQPLSCWYQNNGHSLLLLQPGKLEQISKSPYLVIYHNFLTDKDIKTLKAYALPRLERLGAMNKKGDFISTEKRISKTALIFKHKLKGRIWRRIEALTTTSRFGYETLQVTNYGFGGWYTEHTDHFPERILSDVQAGGATVFTRLYETIYPEAGKAVFWHNTIRNGTGDGRARHAACPVLAGDKWVLNQWILQEGQEFLRPCSLDKLE